MASQTAPARVTWEIVLPILAVGFVLAILAPEILAKSAPSPTPLQRAERAFQDGDTATAARLFAPLAAAGDVRAQYWLADIALNDPSATTDPHRAIALLTKAAGKGYRPAETELGEIYLKGQVVLQDFAAAKTWLEKAARAGDVAAAADLGQIYAKGWGVAADPVEAYAWDAVAAAHGSRSARRRRDEVLSGLPAASLIEAQSRATVLVGEFTTAELMDKSRV